jgi:hypothetical protein
MTAANLHSVIHLLPNSMQVMVGQLGVDGVLRLVATYGGQDLRIPTSRGHHNCAAENRLADGLGCPQLAAHLIQFYPGETLYIPGCRAALITLRNAELHSVAEAALREGKSMVGIVAALARRYDISTRQVWNILKQPAPSFDPAPQTIN